MIRKIVLAVYLLHYVQSEKGAISEQRVVIHQVKSEQSDKPNIGAKQADCHEEYAWSYPSYEFSYKVNDPTTHDVKGQHEKRDGDEVKGLYWLIEPNGHKRTINYQADDHNGFNAQVDYIANKQNKEYELKNINEDDDEKIDKEIPEIKEEEKKYLSYKVQEIINEHHSVNEQTDFVDSNMDNQNNLNSQDNIEIGDTERKTSDAPEYNEESKNNDNNMVSNSQNLEKENTIKDQKENKEENVEYNRRRKRVNVNRNKNSGIRDNVKNNEDGRSNQNNYRYRDIEHNKQPNVSNKDQENQKRAVRGSKNKENKNNIDLKNSHDERKEQTNNHELRFVDLDNKEDLARNIEDNKHKKFEHRIRIHHPKFITSNTDDKLHKH